MWKWLEEQALNQLRSLTGLIAKHGPAWLPGALQIAVAILTSLLTLVVVIESLVRAQKAVRDVLPGLTEAERQRNTRRRRLCKLLEKRMCDLNRASQWSDETYTDLEAEVESEGRRFSHSFFFGLFRQRQDLRREKSLASAIAKTRERLVVLEGPAGCGKTVALRHVVLRLARAADGSSNGRPITLYVNLKTLAREPGQPVGAALIERHVREYTNELGYPDFDPFFTEELKRGREDGSMIFLFDSFDEIPEILSATDANESIRHYGKAGSGQRARVASRPFRGPKRLGWPVFRVLPLTPERQKQFIITSKLGEATETQLLGELPNARLELHAIAENPLFLRLLCGHVRFHAAFPANVFEVFETFDSRGCSCRDGRDLGRRVADANGRPPHEFRGGRVFGVWSADFRWFLGADRLSGAP